MNEIGYHIGFYKALGKHSHRQSIIFRYISKIRRTEESRRRIVLTVHLYFMMYKKIRNNEVYVYNNSAQKIFVQTEALIYKNFPVRTVRIKYQ